MRILTAGVRVVWLLPVCGHFSFCQVALSSFDILVCAWSYCGLLCGVWMISLEGLLFSERRLWGWFWERGEVEKRDWEGGQKGETAVMMEYMRKELKTYKKNNNSHHISNVSLRVEIWIFSSRIRKYERCPLLSFLFRMEQRILERVTSEEKNTIYGNYKIKIFIYRWVSFVYKNCQGTH